MRENKEHTWQIITGVSTKEMLKSVRVIVKHILKKYGYQPDKQEKCYKNGIEHLAEQRTAVA